MILGESTFQEANAKRSSLPALYKDVPFVTFDEPTAALDLIALSRALCNAFRKKIPLPALCAERGRGITLNTLRSR